MAEGIRLLELARNARDLFDQQQASEKRRLLNFLVSNCTLKDGRLTAEFRQPFDLLADAVVADARVEFARQREFSRKENWLLRRWTRTSNPPVNSGVSALLPRVAA
jgi:hypothetical protein